jgi:hypothetical protein
MTTTFISILVTALAIEADKRTRFTHNTLPVIAFIGVIAVLWSLTL